MDLQNHTEAAPSHQLLFTGNSEMNDRIRAYPWEQTPIGTPDQWPQSLRLSVNLLLSSRFPMFIWWGAGMITLYNDAYSVILGEKHPLALGRSGPDVWQEIWDVVGPLAREVKEEGKATWAEDQLLYINRKGFIEESYFTFSYSPIYEEDGSVGGVFCACAETTGKVLATRQLKESEQRLRNMILQAPAAMCILRGTEYHIEVANEKMFELWGISPEETAGKPLFDLVPEAKDQGYEEILAGVLQTGEAFTGREHTVNLPRNGKMVRLFVNYSCDAIREADGSISSLIIMAIDVTDQVLARQRIEEVVAARTKELARSNKALTYSNEELARSNQNLEEFAYAASHDLKEPMRKIHLFTDRLRDRLSKRIGEEEKRFFDRILHATHRMNSLIDDLLLYSHVSRVTALEDSVDLNEKVRLVLRDLDLLVEEKNARIRVDSLPTIRGHRRQLQQLFLNLIGNALKYSRTDVIPEVTIHCRVVTAEDPPLPKTFQKEKERYYLIEVRDNGIGFEPEDAERIFNVFTRLHGNAEYKGTGVGLSIVRKVAENHGGFCWAESEPGSGSAFMVLFPAD